MTNLLSPLKLIYSLTVSLLAGLFFTEVTNPLFTIFVFLIAFAFILLVEALTTHSSHLH